MKVSIEIDCTPQEARSFLGLPDVQPMQQEMLEQLRKPMTDAIHAMDPAEMMKQWLPGSTGLEQFQDFFATMTGSKRSK